MKIFFLLSLIIFLFLSTYTVFSEELVSPHKLILNAEKLMDINKFDEAISLLKKSMMLDPNIPYTYYFLGRCYENLGDYEDAVEYYKKVRQLTSSESGDSVEVINPSSRIDNIYQIKKNAELDYNKAKLALENGDFRLAISLLEKAIKLYNDNGKYYYLLARVYQDLGEKKQAFRNYEKAYYFYGDDRDFLKNFFYLCVYMKDTKNALRIANKIAQSGPLDDKMKNTVYMLSKDLRKNNDIIPLIVWKRAGKTVIIEHSFKEWENPSTLSFKEFDVYRGKIPLVNPLTNEIIYEQPAKKIGRIRIERVLKRVIMATILNEEPSINVGDYIFVQKK